MNLLHFRRCLVSASILALCAAGLFGQTGTGGSPDDSGSSGSSGMPGSSAILGSSSSSDSSSASASPPAAVGSSCVTPTTGATLPVNTFSVERIQTLSNLLGTGTPTIPANVLASIQGNALEVRDRLIFNSQRMTITSTLFTMAPGSPLPTPITADLSKSTLGTFTINLNLICTSSAPAASVLMAGLVDTGTTTSTSVFGNVGGVPAAVSVGLSSDTPPKINNVVVVIAGTVAGFSPSAGGTVEFPPPAPAPPPGTTGITITFNPSSLVAVQRVAHIDAIVNDPSGSTPLTYQWTVQGKTAALQHGNTSGVDIEFGEGFGDYTLQLTVTNAKGTSATATIVIKFVGR